MNKVSAIDTASDFHKGYDITLSEEKIVKDIFEITGFIAEKNIWRSSYWGSNQIGASHWLGKYNNKNSVLKIQGAKPEISEIYIINEFSKQNKSKQVRPPAIYENILWDDKKGYEAIICEHASGDRVIMDGVMTTTEKVKTFFSYFKEYRNNCIPKKPWLAKPSEPIDFDAALDRLVSNSNRAYPDGTFRDRGDIKLAKKSYDALSNVYKDTDLEFMHGHFSCKDLIYENKNSDKVVLFSNLFWKWKQPFADYVFAYHWFMYELSNVIGITELQVESQRRIWLDEIHKIVEEKDLRLLNAALLERSVAGFMIDSFLCDPKKPISKYLYESSKNEARRLIEEIEY